MDLSLEMREHPTTPPLGLSTTIFHNSIRFSLGGCSRSLPKQPPTEQRPYRTRVISLETRSRAYDGIGGVSELDGSGVIRGPKSRHSQS